ncbi:ABC transporter substrate-binding protein [Amycolatopsis panacis]|uniref:ABC transporter substrate-binding protein n=1 Tax=Amycolatopsis panacis TaxID=2340917 RepID=A0A419IBA3_9PSEU|nr:ABC transporter substrate-binding protein [Amycolatopsis panacis]RJQ91289.1 ABC transporter substrate-binding protein [Amycolatopsis panacis]
MPNSGALVATFSLVAATALLVSGCASGTTSPSADQTPSAQVIPGLHDQLPQQVRDSGVLMVATDPQYPPCDFTNDSGQIDGFNHDLLMAMAPRLGVKIQQEAISFDGLLPGVQSGRFTAAMECITDNVEREKTVKFIDYAYATKSVLTSSKNNKGITKNPLSVCGLRAGVQTGTEFVTDVELFTKNCKTAGRAPVQVTNFPSAGDQNTALQSGRIDFAVTNTATGAWQAKVSNKAFDVVPNPLLSRTYVGIVVAPDADSTAQALLGALNAMVKDGTYDKVMAKWDIKEDGLNEPGINLATTRPLTLPQPCGACGF